MTQAPRERSAISGPSPCWRGHDVLSKRALRRAIEFRRYRRRLDHSESSAARFGVGMSANGGFTAVEIRIRVSENGTQPGPAPDAPLFLQSIRSTH